MGKWSRRAFLTIGGLAGGGLLLGIGGAVFAPNRLSIKGSDADAQRIATWVSIHPDNTVTVLVPHCDIGQGAQTALAMMLAEELDADWALVRVQEAPALDAYGNGYMVQSLVMGVSPPAMLRRVFDMATLGMADSVGEQVTGGSSSVRATGELGMRTAGAASRAVLIQAAANAWGVDPAACTAAHSVITHAASGRTVTYGAVASAAALLDLPASPALKPHTAWRLVGTSPPRLDIPQKVDGSAKFGIDTVLPDMLYATVIAAPVFGGKLVSVDEAPARAVPGVVAVVKLDDAVAVVADSYWRALKAVRALKPEFDAAGNGAVTSASIGADFAAKLAADAGKTDKSLGDGADALGRAAHVLNATYTVPFQAHATMEPPNATVKIADGRCDIWTGVQDPLSARAIAAKAAGLSRSAVTLNNCKIGGGFGRKLPGAFDFIDQAVRVAAAVSPRPVKLIWSREEDIAHDFYRQAATINFKGGLDSDGNALVWTSHYTGTADDSAARFAYRIAHQHIAKTDVPFHVRKGYWRSVDHSQHGFFTESFIDELAAAAGRDPFVFRRDLLEPGSRQRAVLELAAEKSGWGEKLPAGRGRGIALVESFGSIVAQVALVGVDAKGTLKILRVTAAVDCGDLVHSDTATAQIEGGIMFGLSAAVYGEITIANGAVAQQNFTDFPVAHMADAPVIDVHFIASHAPRGGMGEVGVPPIAPAVANAIFAATGQRIRSLPIKNHDLTQGRNAA